MIIWSKLRSVVQPTLNNAATKDIAKRFMGHGPRVFPLQPSRFQWNKFKDLFHFYVMVGAIPLAALTFYANVFIGPATLTPIPEDYTPKHWEYYRHPITRWISRYIFNSPQQDYEKLLHCIFEENERRDLRRAEQLIKNKIKERNDYQAYYYKPVLAKYYRVSREAADYLESIRGD